jgi:hypothetical protein
MSLELIKQNLKEDIPGSVNFCSKECKKFYADGYLESEIGEEEIFIIDSDFVKVKTEKSGGSCQGCFLHNPEKTNHASKSKLCSFLTCQDYMREDNESVIFRELHSQPIGSSRSFLDVLKSNSSPEVLAQQMQDITEVLPPGSLKTLPTDLKEFDRRIQFKENIPLWVFQELCMGSPALDRFVTAVYHFKKDDLDVVDFEKLANDVISEIIEKVKKFQKP